MAVEVKTFQRVHKSQNHGYQIFFKNTHYWQNWQKACFK